MAQQAISACQPEFRGLELTLKSQAQECASVAPAPPWWIGKLPGSPQASQSKMHDKVADTRETLPQYTEGMTKSQS